MGELLWDQDSGESVCTSCGAVSTAPSQAFSDIAQAIGLGESRNILEKESALNDALGVSTIIGGQDIDAKGQRLGQSRDLKQLRRLDTIVTWDSKRRRLGKVSAEVRRISQSLGLNSIVAERAFEIYLRKFDQKSLKARSLAAVAAASICIACRELDIARPPNEVLARQIGVNKKQLRHYYHILLGNEAPLAVPAPANYVSKISAMVSLGGPVERAAIEILARVKGHPSLVGKRPTSIAAAALYLASVRVGARTTQLRLAYAAGVTPITIRKRALEITEILGTSTPE